MERQIGVEVQGGFVRTDSKNAGVQGEVNATSLHIVFSEDWAVYGKWIVWHNALGEDEKTALLSHTAEEEADPLVFDTPIPGEAMTAAGWCSFRLEGRASGTNEAAVSATAWLYVKPAEGRPGGGSGTGGCTCTGELLQFQQELDENRASISLTAEEIRAEVQDRVNGLSSKITQTASEIRSEVTDHVNDLSSEIAQTAESIRTEVTGVQGQVSTIEQTAGTIQTRLTNAEGSLNTLSQSAAATVSRIEGVEGDISQLEQTAQGLTTRVEGTEGGISRLEQTAQGLTTRVEGTEGDISTLKQTVDGFTFSVSDPVAGEDGRYVTMEISMGGNTWRGVVQIDGNVEVTGSVAAQALYAIYGSVAKLTVDSLSTSRRIPLYLAGDSSDDNYIHIQGKKMRFTCAQATGETEQAIDPEGAPLYWEKDISSASLGVDGYPYVDGARVFTTTLTTAWPVTVYRYTEQDKLSLEFDDSDIHEPRLSFGVGWGDEANTDRGRGFLQKTHDSFDLWFVGHEDSEAGVRCGDYLELVGLRGTSALDFSGWDSGSFTETLDGKVQANYTVSFDAAGRPTKIADGDGNSMTIAW